MNNVDVQQSLADCDADLLKVHSLIDGLGITSNIVPYLTQYAIVRACGAIEVAYKTVIADYCSHRSKKQIKRFIDKRIREGSANPSLANINKFLSDFDEDWKENFKAGLDSEPNKSSLLTSLQSLVNARNVFSHGGSPAASISDIILYFSHSRKIIEIIDSVIV